MGMVHSGPSDCHLLVNQVAQGGGEYPDVLGRAQLPGKITEQIKEKAQQLVLKERLYFFSLKVWQLDMSQRLFFFSCSIHEDY